MINWYKFEVLAGVGSVASAAVSVLAAFFIVVAEVCLLHKDVAIIAIKI
jgi:hypothetical protein